MHKNIETKLQHYLDNEKFCELLDSHNIVDLFAGVDEFDIPWLIDILKEEGIQIPQSYLNMYDLSRAEFPEFDRSHIAYDEPLSFNAELHMPLDSLFAIKLINLIYYKEHSGLFGNIDNVISFDDILFVHHFDIEHAHVYVLLQEPLEPEADVSKYNLPKVQIVADNQDSFITFDIKDRSFYELTTDFEFEDTGYNYKVNIDRFIECVNELFEWLNSINI